MPIPILQTKLYAPPSRPDLILRPHLIDTLNEGLHRKLTLISAPAGFGRQRSRANGSPDAEDQQPGYRWTKGITI
ncbi:hypothetical protein KFU94_52320 [Chloroflexi bacterium TSY]|nr:hypothetical protein [Chloroflexi bacterium TSY]